MAITRISNNVRNAVVDAAAAEINDGAGPGYVEIRTGTMPASVGTAATGTLLGTLICSDPAFAAAVNGTATANPVTQDSAADASGTATWFRVYDSNGLAVLDGDISTTAAGTGAMLMDSTSVVAGGVLAISSWTLTIPAG